MKQPHAVLLVLCRIMETSSTRPQHTYPPARPLGTNRLPDSLDFTPGAWPCKLWRRGFGRLRHTYSPSGYNPETSLSRSAYVKGLVIVVVIVSYIGECSNGYKSLHFYFY